MLPTSFLRTYLKIDELQTQEPWIHAVAVTVPTLMTASGLTLLLIAGASAFEPGFQLLRGDDVRLLTEMMGKPLLLLIVGPLLLELIFRKALVKYFEPRFGLVGATLTSACLYGALTLDPIGGTLFALAMTAIYLRTATILAPMITHAVVNLVGLIAAALVRPELGTPLWNGPEVHDPIALALFFALAVVGLPGVYWAVKELLMAEPAA